MIKPLVSTQDAGLVQHLARVPADIGQGPDDRTTEPGDVADRGEDVLDTGT
ncbi:MAG TPA: hypothetical protein VGH72_23450 [Pseudonocardia sp.]|jgi:hypothetical protein